MLQEGIPMSDHPFNFDRIRVAAPCSAKWSEMSGDERSRHCALCKKNVYNLSDMSRRAAEALIREKEGNLCIRFYQRADGTILTDNCPVGLRAIRRRIQWLASGVAAFFALSIGIVWAKGGGQPSAAAVRPTQPFTTLQRHRPIRSALDWIDPPVQRFAVMGKMVAPQITPPVPPPSPPSNANASGGNSNE